MFPTFLSLDKRHFWWEKCRNVSVTSKYHSLNNKSQKDISKVIETINNKGEKGIYRYIHNTNTRQHLLRLAWQSPRHGKVSSQSSQHPPQPCQSDNGWPAQRHHQMTLTSACGGQPGPSSSAASSSQHRDQTSPPLSQWIYTPRAPSET